MKRMETATGLLALILLLSVIAEDSIDVHPITSTARDKGFKALSIVLALLVFLRWMQN